MKELEDEFENEFEDEFEPTELIPVSEIHKRFLELTNPIIKIDSKSTPAYSAVVYTPYTPRKKSEKCILKLKQIRNMVLNLGKKTNEPDRVKQTKSKQKKR